MAFANTFVTLDDVSITNLGTQAGNLLVVSDDGLSLTSVSNTSVIGYTGSQGSTGNVGFTGSVGATGAQGNIGFTGSQGDTGNAGAVGFTGSVGVGFNGSKGDAGFTGSEGNTGYTGSEGTSGYTGSIAYGFTVMRSEQDPANVILADQFNDVLTFSGGNGIDLVFNTGTDTITIQNSGVTGYSGSQGFTGSQGNVGFVGSAGPLGYTGSKGDQGFVGSTGNVGLQGFDGSAGVQGFTGSRGFVGSTGEDGDTGFTGSQGFNGSRGFQGYSGSQGFTGSQGTLGYSGSKGDRGNVGITGFTGSRGLQGYTGSIGAPGLTGSQGATGFMGSQGIIGFSGSQGFTGDQGFQGSAGFTGSVGLTGSLGFIGSRGVQGYTGSRGFTGSTGPQGLLGPQGPTGFNGSQGLRGFTGSAPVAFRTFRVIDGVRQENIIADQTEDVIDFVAGAGITITADGELDQMIFTSSTAEDILGDLSVLQNTPTGSISTLEYNEAGLFTFTSASPDAIVASANINLTNYYTKSETYNKEEVNALVANAGGGGGNLSNYYTKPETNSLLAQKMGQFTVTNGFSLFTVTDNETITLAGSTGQINNDLNPATQTVTWSLDDNLQLANATVNGTLFSNDITATGDVTIEGANTIITGNLTVLGNTTTINSNVISSGDTIIVLNADLPSNVPPSQNLGLEGNRGTEANVFLIWDEAADVWTVQNQDFVARRFIGEVDISANSIVDLNDVSVNGLDNGEILVWDAANATWTNTSVDFTDIVETVMGLENNVQILQGNVVSIENELANIADTDSQTLSWDAGTANLAISNGNNVDMSDLYQDLSLNTASNVLTISDGNSVDFTPILGGGGGGGGTSTIERFRIDYDVSGSITGISGATSGIASTTIVDAATGLIQFELDTATYSFPMAQITFFGYDQQNDRYFITALESINGTRFLDGDGGTVFDGTPSQLTVDLLADRPSTFADAGFGQTTHAYVQMTCTTT